MKKKIDIEISRYGKTAECTGLTRKGRRVLKFLAGYHKNTRLSGCRWDFKDTAKFDRALLLEIHDNEMTCTFSF